MHVAPMETAKLLFAVLGIGTCVFIAIDDVRRFRITNYANLALAIPGAGFWLLQSPGQLLVNALYAAVLSLPLLYMFARGKIGGGDLKFFLAALIWTGPGYGIVFAAILFVTVAVTLILIKIHVMPRQQGPSGTKIPFGFPGGLALGVSIGIMVILWPSILLKIS